jgi:hypothetical protein
MALHLHILYTSFSPKRIEGNCHGPPVHAHENKSSVGFEGYVTCSFIVDVIVTVLHLTTNIYNTIKLQKPIEQYMQQDAKSDHRLSAKLVPTFCG